jgi:hypothetical protein
MVVCSLRTSRTTSGSFKMISCKVGDVGIDLILDLGAKVSIIEQKFLRSISVGEI